MNNHPMTNRQCFPCTACCEGWLTAEINGVTMRPGKPCIHSMKQGCGIYEKRPKIPCVAFKCAWLQEPTNWPEHMKPNECGAIVVFVEWKRQDVISAIPIGQKIPADTLDWLMTFAREESIPLMFSERLMSDGKYVGIKRTGYGPPSFIHTVETQIMPEDIMKF
jgi:hypothetical protein